MRTSRSIVIGVVLALAVAACGSSGSSKKSSGTSSGSANGAGSGATTTAKKLTGAPIRLMVIGSFSGAGLNFTSIPKAAQAAAAAVNRAGGVDGRPIEVESCDQGIDPNKAGDCARKAVTDKIVAVVGAFTTDGDQYIPVLEKAGIPSVADYAISFPEFTSKISYPVAGGALSGIAGMGALFGDNGIKKVDIAYLDVGAGKLAAGFADQGLKPRGGSPVTTTPVPINGADLTPSVSATIDKKPEGVGLALTDPELSKWILAFRQSGGTAKVCVSGSSLNPTNLKALGQNAEGVYVSNNYKPASMTSDPGVKKMLTEVDAYDKSIQLVDPSIGAWAGVHLVADALQHAASKDSPGLIASLDADKSWDLGVVAPVNFSTPNPSVSKLGITRLFNLDVVYAQVKNGKVRALTGKFVDPLTAG